MAFPPKIAIPVTLRRVSVGVALWLGATAVAPASGWCDLLFKDVSDKASLVVVAHYAAPKGEPPRLLIDSVWKGSTERTVVDAAPQTLFERRPREGDQFLLALDERFRPVEYVSGLGGCLPIAVVPLHGGKLRARDRDTYDGQSQALTLDQLRADLSDPENGGWTD